MNLTEHKYGHFIQKLPLRSILNQIVESSTN